MTTIINYGMGNLRSVAKAFEAIGCSVRVTDDPADLADGERIVLPGDGAFAAGMGNLQRLGMIEPLRQAVVVRGTPFLGICLGMQLLCRTGFEQGVTPGLQWIDAEVRSFEGHVDGLKIPHMGWNDVIRQRDSILLDGLPARSAFYFVHSYHMVTGEPRQVKGVCHYGVQFPAVLEAGNIFATQFHPEKSQRAGLRLLQNFVDVPAASC